MKWSLLIEAAASADATPLLTFTRLNKIWYIELEMIGLAINVFKNNISLENLQVQTRQFTNINSSESESILQ